MGLPGRVAYPSLKERIMNTVKFDAGNMTELSESEINEISGGAVVVAVKIVAWAIGAGFGAGLVVAVKHALE